MDTFYRVDVTIYPVEESNYCKRKRIDMDKNLADLTISEIAALVRKDWTNVNYGAVPYLDAMDDIVDIKDKYFFDDGKDIVLYFLANAQTWRGEVARSIKKELKSRL